MPTLILDTNVVLDWLVFQDPLLVDFTRAVQTRRVDVLTHPAALAELRRVLNYPILKLSAVRQQEVYEDYRSHCREAKVPVGFSATALLMPVGFPNCRDRDDQLFLALALHTQASALVSKDNAVLALRKKASKFGVTIMEVAPMRDRFVAVALRA